MIYCVVCRYIRPTNAKGARVKASYDGKSVTISWDHSQNFDENMVSAFHAISKKCGFTAGIRAVMGMVKPGEAIFTAIDPNEFVTTR